MEHERLGLEVGAERSTKLGQNIYAGRSSETNMEHAMKHQTISNVVTNKTVPSMLTTHFPCRDDISSELAKVRENLQTHSFECH